MRLETLAIHAGRAVDPATGAVRPPIHLSTTFERDPDGGYARGYVYARYGNPNRAALEEALAALEGGAAALAFASGSAATMSVFQALEPGDHVVAPLDAYHGTVGLLREHFTRWGLEVTFADLTDPEQLEAALRPNTRLVWVETPSNPLLRITDIRRVVEAAHAVGARVVCDNTWATPVLQRPLALGCDLVVHATTKYLNGHGDVTGGVVVAREVDAWFERLRAIQVQGGAVPSPFDAWLVLRGLATLPYRVRAHTEHAARVAAFLQAHPAVEAVHYPGLADHPGHAVAARQMEGFGGMLAFQVRGGREAALAVAARVRLITRATSLGGVESLIEHRASIEGPGTRTPENLLRLSVGLEHPEDLIADLEQALEAAV
ncbi:trans-sulfuration enzyme family protein [Marinithermus hydrothermalis]|uniref:Cys/Met metabolism pyridoxal-phosphate-dependent protein n=1 Tax=Marinithermus hydrothermalis (strain DSM 14884 / JCM 11576 / T1) TaxID=869210 RepID=F2NNU9_MARHT|nr:aminotransferase class V-fold PLP-dependent enzyme [Marinithermus hydrothermalis]AEB11323.1 Cys/Met metabolism pyridoxal-phosphate-dependent protein [Marinithermus hydrothermalis DSM 14884]